MHKMYWVASIANNLGLRWMFGAASWNSGAIWENLDGELAAPNSRLLV